MDVLNLRPVTISGLDFIRLAPLLMDELKTKFSFSTGKAVITPLNISRPYDEVLSGEILSERQFARASESIGSNEAFLDRIGLKVFIPVSCDEDVLGLLILSGISRVIGPEEGERILPLLKAYIEERLQTLRLETSIAARGEPPPYLVLCLENLLKDGKDTEPSFLHLVWARARAGRVFYAREALLDMCAELWPGSAPEWMGGNQYEAWLYLPHIDGPKLSLGLKDIMARARRFGLFLSNAYGHSFPKGADPRLYPSYLKDTEASAMALGISVISSDDLMVFKDKIGVQDIVERFSALNNACKGLKNAIFIFARPVSMPRGDVHLDGIKFIEAGPDSVFIVQKPSDFSQDQTILKDMVERSLKLCTLTDGIPVTLGIYRTAGAISALPAIYAYLHAVLLGQGALAVFDAVTLNVWGDELFSWGDLAGACRAYRQGLKLDPSSANLLNSLGVALARLGKIKEASNVFLRAINSSPEEFMAYYNLGELLMDMDRANEAEKVLRTAYRLEPGDIRVAVRFAEALLNNGKTEEAEGVLEPFIDSYMPGMEQKKEIPAAVFSVMGRIAYHGRGGWQKAKEAWLEAVRRDPTDTQSLAFLALGYIEMEKDMDTARRFLRQSKSFDRDRRRTKRLVSIIEKALRKYQKISGRDIQPAQSISSA
ncbi:MAG: tetratricopeptide repeat protein [Dissulfurimicrobium sp.]|uniref:tetratricopeptide repeat protein n=1 Tax=Dissulfurimicrobium sp. TaxID=2022436 RepID=UPI00404A4003